MGETTNISWTDATHNFWYGCNKVSPGCKNCYAEREMQRFGRDFNVVTRAKNFNAPLKWTARKVFVCSWSDFFHPAADEWRDEAWAIIRHTSHIYQILTKRPENIKDRLPPDWGDGWPNVWLLASTEDQETYDRRWAILSTIPVVIRGISAEPLLGTIDLRLAAMEKRGTSERYQPRPDWVICGGESGPEHRPLDISAAQYLKDQCLAFGIPFFYKQSSGPRPGMSPLLDGIEYKEFPNATHSE